MTRQRIREVQELFVQEDEHNPASKTWREGLPEEENQLLVEWDAIFSEGMRQIWIEVDSVAERYIGNKKESEK